MALHRAVEGREAFDPPAERDAASRSRRGKPQQNGLCKAFNARMRDEPLNETLFFSLGQAREALARCIADDNHRRPHAAIGYHTPAAHAAQLTATDDRLRIVDALPQPPAAPSARERRSDAPTPIPVG